MTIGLQTTEALARHQLVIESGHVGCLPDPEYCVRVERITELMVCACNHGRIQVCCGEHVQADREVDCCLLCHAGELSGANHRYAGAEESTIIHRRNASAHISRDQSRGTE